MRVLVLTFTFSSFYLPLKTLPCLLVLLFVVVVEHCVCMVVVSSTFHSFHSFDLVCVVGFMLSLPLLTKDTTQLAKLYGKKRNESEKNGDFCFPHCSFFLFLFHQSYSWSFTPPPPLWVGEPEILEIGG